MTERGWPSSNKFHHLAIINFKNKYIQQTISVPKRRLLGGWYLSGLIVNQQRYRLSTSDSNKSATDLINSAYFAKW